MVAKFIVDIVHAAIRAPFVLCSYLLKPKDIHSEAVAALTTIAAVFIIVAVCFLGGAPRALFLSFVIAEIGTRFWIHDVGIPWTDAFFIVLLTSTVMQGFWFLFAHWASLNWDTVQERHADFIKKIGPLAGVGRWLANQTSAGKIELHGYLQWCYERARLPLLLLAGFIPSMFLFVGLPLILRERILRGFTMILVGNALKMYLAALGWHLFPIFFWAPIAVFVVGSHIWSHRMKQRGYVRK